MKKLAMIGCGGIGGYHLSHFVNFNDIDLVGFCDLIPERAEDFVKRAGKGRAFTNYIEMYDAVKPDMVFVCIPPYRHGDVERETIKRGIHMFVEKPVSLDLDMAMELRDKIAEKNLITAVGFQCRYDNINETARSFIAKNRIVAVEASRVGGVPEVEWWRHKDLSGGQLVEQTVHQMDLLRYFMGEVDTVYSVARRGFLTASEWPGYDTDDVTTTIMVFKDGTAATMMTGCYSTNGASWDSKMTFGAPDSRMDYILCSHVNMFGIAGKAADIAGTVKGDGTQRRDENEEAVRVGSNVDFGTICDRTFIDAVISGDASAIRSPYSDAVKTLALVLACNESMATGMPVKVRA